VGPAVPRTGPAVRPTGPRGPGRGDRDPHPARGPADTGDVYRLRGGASPTAATRRRVPTRSRAHVHLVRPR